MGDPAALDRYAALVAALRDRQPVALHTIAAVLTAAGRSHSDLMTDAFPEPGPASCGVCGAALTVRTSWAVGAAWRKQRMICRACGGDGGVRVIPEAGVKRRRCCVAYTSTRATSVQTVLD